MNASFTICRLTAGVLTIAGALSASAQPSAAVPPGVPEPGIVLWGRVVAAGSPVNGLPIESVRWEVRDGARVATFDATSRPATQIRQVGGQNYYILAIPFDTRRLSAGSSEVQLTDPASSGRPSFELKSSTPTTYRCVAIINGLSASVHAVNSVPYSGELPEDFEAQDFTLAARGRVIRVDLSVSPPTTSYDEWARRIWGSPDHPDAAATSDPDGDGVPNSDEFEAGTNPTDADSFLRILGLTVSPETSTVIVSWRSVAERRYQIESAPNLPGSWTVRDERPGLADQTVSSFPLDPLGHFYRVRVLPLP